MTEYSNANVEVIKLSLILFISFTATTSHNNIISYMFEQKQMPQVGPAALICRFLAYIISTILGPSIPLSLKQMLLLGTFLGTINLGSGIIAANCNDSAIVMILSCGGYTIGGAAIGILKLSQGRYLHLICQFYNIHSTRGQLLGLSQMIYSLSILAGSFTTFILIGYFTFTTYLIVITLMAFCSFLICLLVLEEIQTLGLNRFQQLCSKTPQSKQRIDFIIQLIEKEKKHQKVKEYTVMASLSKTLSYVPKIIYLFPYFAVYGLSAGIKLNLVPHLVPSSLPLELRNKQTGLCQIWVGIGSIIGGYGSSHLSDILGTLWTGKITLMLFAFDCWLFILTTNIENTTMTYFTSLLLGIGAYSFQGLFSVIYSKHLGGHKQVYAINKIVYSTTVLLFQTSMTITHNQLPSTGFVVFSLLTIPTMFFLDYLPRPTCEKSQSKD